MEVPAQEEQSLCVQQAEAEGRQPQAVRAALQSQELPELGHVGGGFEGEERFIESLW